MEKMSLQKTVSFYFAQSCIVMEQEYSIQDGGIHMNFMGECRAKKYGRKRRHLWLVLAYLCREDSTQIMCFYTSLFKKKKMTKTPASEENL
jgi:hypothetical protein